MRVVHYCLKLFTRKYAHQPLFKVSTVVLLIEEIVEGQDSEFMLFVMTSACEA